MTEAIINGLNGIRVIDIIDIAIVALVLYKVLMFIQETRAQQLLKGLILLLIATKVSEVFKLYTINWILKNTMTLGMIAIIIVFQPELRRGLEYIGRGKFLNKSFVELDKESASRITQSIVDALKFFSNQRIGCLIILERETVLGEVMETGTTINAEVSKELLVNLFNTSAPLHDGAVIVRGNKILAAGCVLPLTSNNNLSKELGTRHRAGIGITENSDAVAVIVSEETGGISIAMDGHLSRFMDLSAVEKVILSVYLSQIEEKASVLPFIKNFWRQKNDNK